MEEIHTTRIFLKRRNLQVMLAIKFACHHRFHKFHAACTKVALSWDCNYFIYFLSGLCLVVLVNILLLKDFFVLHCGCIASFFLEQLVLHKKIYNTELSAAILFCRRRKAVFS